MGKVDPLSETQNADGMKLWSFWEGQKPGFIELCQETLLQHNPEAVILNMQSFRKMQEHDRDVDLSHLKLVHQVDWIRLYLLKHYGGIWLDADCIVMRPLGRFIDALRCCWSLAYCETRTQVGGGFFGTPPNSFHIDGIYAKATAIVRSGRPVKWRQILGSNIDAELRRHGYAGFFRCDRNQFMPIKFHHCPEVFFVRTTDTEHAKRYQELAYTYMLGNHSYPHPQRDMSAEELLRHDYFISYLFRRALNFNGG